MRCVAFSANDEMIVTGSLDNSIIRWNTSNGEQIGKPIILNDWIRHISISADGAVLVSHTGSDGLCRWDAINGQLIDETVSKKWHADYIWTNNDCTEIITWTKDTRITLWCIAPGGAISEKSMLPLSAEVTAFVIDMNHGVAAFGLLNGAVAVCDIHE